MLRDRGTMKWTSLMLPEHVELLKEMWEEDNKISRPELDPQEVEHIEREIVNAFHTKQPISLAVYNDGTITSLMGYIDAIDTRTQSCRLMCDDTTPTTIRFQDIVAATSH